MLTAVLNIINSFSTEDSSYVSALALTLVLSVLVSYTPPGNVRKWSCTLSGLLFTVLYCNYQAVHVLLFVAATYTVTVCVSIKQWKPVTFFLLFLYISTLRLLHVFSIWQLNNFVNGVLMILVLKMISAVFDHRDAVYNKRLISQDVVDDEIRLKSVKMPEYNMLDLFHYSFCFMGLFTGPIFTYRTYYDFVHQRFTPKKSDKIPEILHRLKFFIVIIPLFLFFSRYKSAYLHTEEFAETTVFFKIAYMFPLFTMFRLRMYFGWLLAEVCFVIAGFGAYPKWSEPKPGKGPTKKAYEIYSLSTSVTDGIGSTGGSEAERKEEERETEYSFETVRNMDVVGVETMLTMQDGVRCWNMCVQWWLVQYTFKECPIKSMRKPATFFVSALWHGVRSGYFLSFMCVPLLNFSAVIFEKAFMKNETIQKSRVVSAIVTVISWVLTNQYWNYLNMAFYLLSGAQTLKFWSQIYFLYHGIAITIILCNYVVKKLTKKPKVEKAE
ncbi:lysophospholipid acyltransferase 7-like [Symsagittifera roscoffensis]|uniref:lysophospholipid acyltransferase 7-like n=1 Tax=Symsagittifera roscoffensis TaxID=84072 RepID=UPI00307BDA52